MIEGVTQTFGLDDGQVLEQTWFAGVHSNIGGGYAPDGLANEALHWIVEKAEGLGLAFDKSFLLHYRPCFNSAMRESMTLMYKVMGTHLRPLGEHAADGECGHKSAVDRLNLPAYGYDPDNLRAHIALGASHIVDTTRVPRGAPC